MHVNLSIKSVPEALAARLRQRAERNHRSLQGELMAIIERAATEEVPAAAMAARQAAAPAQRAGLAPAKSLEQWLLERRVRPVDAAAAALPRSVDIVRELRDTRDGTSWRGVDRA